MLSDMAEGSADYETDYDPDEGTEDYEMSGDGSGRGKTSQRWLFFRKKTNMDFLAKALFLHFKVKLKCRFTRKIQNLTYFQ